MNTPILVAGGTGNLGGRIVTALLKRGATVRAVVRAETDPAKVDELVRLGVDVRRVDMTDVAALTQACAGAGGLVSAVAGLHDVIVDGQAVLLAAAVAAGVPRFIPSDFCSDYTRQAAGENRNFDLRREFQQLLDQAPIRATSVLNGAFAELLTYNVPLLDFKQHQVGYWEDADWHIDFTTIDDTAAFTAAAVLDSAAPRYLRIASFQSIAAQLAQHYRVIIVDIRGIGSYDRQARSRLRQEDHGGRYLRADAAPGPVQSRVAGARHRRHGGRQLRPQLPRSHFSPHPRRWLAPQRGHALPVAAARSRHLCL